MEVEHRRVLGEDHHKVSVDAAGEGIGLAEAQEVLHTVVADMV